LTFTLGNNDQFQKFNYFPFKNNNFVLSIIAKMKVGLFFGSFNPVHIGHLIIANYMVEFTDLEQVWFVVSPQNPFKKKKSLLPDYHRLALVREAIIDDNRFRACDIEMKMPVPSYTIDTLTYLREKYPDHTFVIIMGADGLPTFDKWKNYEEIIRTTQRYVYPRPGININPVEHPNCVFVEAPLMEISSSFIRDCIREKKDVRYFLHSRVYEYIRDMHFYE
jgi:nicotinate-nucleotide adenylyltransferase